MLHQKLKYIDKQKLVRKVPGGILKLGIRLFNFQITALTEPGFTVILYLFFPFYLKQKKENYIDRNTFLTCNFIHDSLHI